MPRLGNSGKLRTEGTPEEAGVRPMEEKGRGVTYSASPTKKVRGLVLFPSAWLPLLSFCAVGYSAGVKWGILAGWVCLALFLLLLPRGSRLNAFTLFTSVYLIISAASIPSLGPSLEKRLPNLLAAAFSSYLVMELFLLTEGRNFLLPLGSAFIPEERKDTPPVRRALDFLAWSWGGVFALGLAINLGAISLGPGISTVFSASVSGGLVMMGVLLTPVALRFQVTRGERKMVERAPLWREGRREKDQKARGVSSERAGTRAECDVVVVGGGLGGLVCALALARRGLRTSLLEKNRGVGGFCQTFEWEGYPLHAGPTFLGGSLLSWPGLEGWRDLLNRTELRRLEWGLTDGRLALRLGAGARRDYAKLSDKFPRDAGALKELLRFLLEMRDEVREGLYFDSMRPGDLADYREGFRRFPRLSRLRHMPYRDFLEECGLGDDLRDLFLALVEGWSGNPGQIPALTGCLLLSDLLIDGIYAPARGFSVLTRELAAQIQENGGSVLLQALAEQVKVPEENADLFRVRIRGGMDLGSRAVVFDLDPRRIPGNLLPSTLFDDEYLKAIASKKPSSAFFSLHLTYPEPLRLPDRVFLIPARPPRIRLGDNAHTVRMIFIAREPQREDNGCSLLVRTPLPPSSFRFFQEDQDLISELSALLKEALFALLPSAKGYSREFTTTPIHYHRLSGAGQGACFGFEPVAGRWPFDLPGPSLPVPGTFLTGAWTASGGGMMGAILSGLASAERVLSFLGLHPRTSLGDGPP